MGRINGQVIFPYVPVAHCLAFRLNFIGMNEMNWNTTYSIHYSKKSTFCPKCTFIPDLSRIEVQLLKLHDNLPEKSFHCQSIIYKQVQVKCQLAILVSGDIGILFLSNCVKETNNLFFALYIKTMSLNCSLDFEYVWLLFYRIISIIRVAVNIVNF